MKQSYKVIFTEELFNKCPRCGKIIKMDYWLEDKKKEIVGTLGRFKKKNEIYIGVCEKDSIIFIADI